MLSMKCWLSLCLVSWLDQPFIDAFAPSRRRSLAPHLSESTVRVLRLPHILRSTEKPEEEDEKKKNPYQDEAYPDLEFIDYSDPEYVVDQGVTDEYFSTDTDEQIELMREERRRKNDEYQFETYFRDILKSGKEYKGEWTVYKTSTFLPGAAEEVDESGFPRLRKVKRTFKVVSRGYKEIIDPNAEWRVDGEILRHEEVLAPSSDSDAYKSSQGGKATKEETADTSLSAELETIKAEARQTEQEILVKNYWPDKMTALDFRGEQGNMMVGNAYSVCTAIPIEVKDEEHDGPFKELRAELGIMSNEMRFRLKLDYSVKDAQAEAGFPALHLKSMAVCREAEELWPREGREPSSDNRVSAEALFGTPGAPGGLYDPPPVGSDEQAGCYMMLDLDGGATILFPHVMEQDPDAYEGNGWVTSLDWTPGAIRYQVDRKVFGGRKLKGLKTLELSEVQGVDADKYRPRDGGENMRQ